jgi:hypothetical protein
MVVNGVDALYSWRASLEAAHADVQAERVLALAGDLRLKDIQVLAAYRLLPPAGLQDVVVGVEAEGAVDLFALEGVRSPRTEIGEAE